MSLIRSVNNRTYSGLAKKAVEGGSSITVDSELSTTSENPVQNKVITGQINSINSTLEGGVVHPETGKGLSENDFTDADKTKLGGIEAQATRNIVDSSLSDSSTNAIQNKVVTDALATKVNSVNGKGLSTNDYTDADKLKLSGISNQATKTVANPTLAGTESDLTALEVDGTKYAVPSGGGTTVIANPTGLTTANLTALQVDNVKYDVFSNLSLIAEGCARPSPEEGFASMIIYPYETEVYRFLNAIDEAVFSYQFVNGGNNNPKIISLDFDKPIRFYDSNSGDLLTCSTFIKMVLIESQMIITFGYMTWTVNIPGDFDEPGQTYYINKEMILNAISSLSTQPVEFFFYSDNLQIGDWSDIPGDILLSNKIKTVDYNHNYVQYNNYNAPTGVYTDLVVIDVGIMPKGSSSSASSN